VISESDKGKWLRFTSSDPVFVVWPVEAEFSLGNEVELFRVGDGPVTVFSEWAQDVRFNGKDDFRLNAKFSQVRAVNGDVSEWDCTYSGDVVFGVYQSPYYISDPGSDPSPIPWTPAQISTALWLDASDAATITEVSGAVSQWDDKSGNDRHATQGTAAARPVIASAAINGLDVVRFDGVNDGLIGSPIWSGSGAGAAFVVYKPLSTAGTYTRTIFGQSSTGVSGTWRLIQYRTQFVIGDPYFAGFSADMTDSVSPTTDAKIGGWTYNGTTGVLYRTGNQTDTDSLSLSTASANYTIGRAGTASPAAEYAPVDVAEIVALTSMPSDATRELIEGYLAWKWGLEDDLPALHPYKSAPPTA
jgi:hypothetical protein